jgi:beta-N-acetylhexosaminidase
MIRRDAVGPVLSSVLALVLACAVTAGCGLTSDGPPTSGGPATTSGGEPAAAGTSSSALSTRAASRSSKQSQPRSCPARVFARMTVAQRVGQLFLVGIAGDPGVESARALTAYHFGSLMFGATTTAGLAAVGQLARADQALASSRATAGVRFFIAADQEGGLVQRLRGPGFPAIPSALIQGELSPGVLQQQAAAWGGELRAAGVNLDLAPVMDVVPPGTAGQNQPIGALQREFGDNPQTVAAHGVAFIRGMRQAGVATTAKHFPGLGRVRGNTDFTSGVVDTVTGPNDPYLGSFHGAIDAGVPFVMVALANYPLIDPRHLAVFSPRVMQTILRQQMRFRGVIVSDDMGAAQAVAGLSPTARAIGFLAAGGDMITSVSLASAVAMDTAVLTRVSHDPAFRSKVNSAVMHVLAAKQAYGLLPCATG